MSRHNVRTPKRRQHRINDEIRFKEIRLVGEHDETGIMPTYKAIKMGDELELDLVCINDKAEVPICKLLDYEKFIYDQEKNKTKQKTIPMKEIKMGPSISDNDLETKVNQINKFLSKGHKVKVLVQFKGRQMAHQDLGLKVLMLLATKVEEYGTPEGIPNSVIGRKLTMFLKPK